MEASPGWTTSSVYPMLGPFMMASKEWAVTRDIKSRCRRVKALVRHERFQKDLIDELRGDKLVSRTICACVLMFQKLEYLGSRPSHQDVRNEQSSAKCCDSGWRKPQDFKATCLLASDSSRMTESKLAVQRVIGYMIDMSQLGNIRRI
jgi:hypothetical protein